MFGKKSKLSETQKFIIAKGREVGNLKKAGAPFNNKNALKTTPGGKTGKPQGKPPFENRKPSPGKFGTFKTEGMMK